jgi:hypothetical protein
MISARKAGMRQQVTRQFAETAFHPVADNCVASLFCDSVANAHLRVAIGSITHKQNKAARGGPFSMISSQKI